MRIGNSFILIVGAKRLLHVAFISLLFAAIAVSQALPDTDWRQHYPVVDTCFTVHGKLQAWNGSPTFRIWIVGTNRILGVAQRDSGETFLVAMPRALTSLVAWDTIVYGNFKVWPLEKFHQGWMQSVAVDSATELVIERNIENADGTCTKKISRLK